MMDREKMERGIRVFLEGVGERFAGDDLEKTPGRVASAWADDLLAGYALDPLAEITWAAAPDGSGAVFVRDVRFSSICVHHLLPFVGRAHIAYLPDRRLAGLSKIGRVIDALSRRLQIQERLTGEIVQALDRALEPRGVLVLLEAEHTCMSLRGVRKENSRMVTVAASGVLETDSSARSDVLRVLAPAPADSGFLT
jgi:GTP cyclohydrolase I